MLPIPRPPARSRALVAALVAALLLPGCAAGALGGLDRAGGPDTGPGRAGETGGGQGGGGDGADSPADPAGDGQLGDLVLGGATRLDAVATVNYRGVDAAWSPAAGLLLVAYGNAPVGGALLDGDGVQVGAGFLVQDQPYDGTNWAQNPRVTPTDAGWLVTWHQYDPPQVVVRGLRAEGGAPTFRGPGVALSTTPTQQESPAALAWAPELGAALVVWATDGLRGRLVGADGQPLGPELVLLPAGTWREMPAVAWQPGCGCWGVTVMAAPAAAEVRLLRVGADGAVRSDVALAEGLEFAKVTDLALDEGTGELVASWYQVGGGAAGFATARVGVDGAVGPARTIFAPYGSYDGWDLAWSPVTGTSLAAFHGAEGAAALTGELARDGAESAPLPLGTAGAESGLYLPRVAAFPERAAWIVVATPDYAAVSVEVVDRRQAGP